MNYKEGFINVIKNSLEERKQKYLNTKKSGVYDKLIFLGWGL